MKGLLIAIIKGCWRLVVGQDAHQEDSPFMVNKFHIYKMLQACAQAILDKLRMDAYITRVPAKLTWLAVGISLHK